MSVKVFFSAESLPLRLYPREIKSPGLKQTCTNNVYYGMVVKIEISGMFTRKGTVKYVIYSLHGRLCGYSRKSGFGPMFSVLEGSLLYIF